MLLLPLSLAAASLLLAWLTPPFARAPLPLALLIRIEEVCLEVPVLVAHCFAHAGCTATLYGVSEMHLNMVLQREGIHLTRTCPHLT